VRRRPKGKRGEEKDKESTGPERTLLGVLTEALGSGAVAAAGNPPRWLREGIGTYMAAQVEPRSPYYRQLRIQAFKSFDRGWPTQANEALGEGNQITADELHAIGFALVEAMMKTELRAGFPAFVNGLLQGGTKLDEMLEKVYEGAKRDDFLTVTGEWIATNYGQLQ
jgi:hypothetical protein